MRQLDEITGIIVDEIFQTYKRYGPGLFERVYEAGLAGRLEARGLTVERQKQVCISDEFITNEPAFFADLLVNGRVIVELKSVEKLNKTHHKQLQTYLRLSENTVGILVNFNCTFLKDNIKRVVYRYDDRQFKLINYKDLQDR